MPIEDTILSEIYPPEEIFVTEAVFDDEEHSVTVTCLVPQRSYYTAKPIPYVTAENYVRCLSQASYILAHHLIIEGLTGVEVSPDEFAKAAVDHELYYRNLAMTFHEKVGKNTQFVMKLVLGNVREIKRMGDFLLFSFTNERTVISGEMSFIYVRGAEA